MIAAVRSESKAYFDGGTDHGDVSNYDGLIRVKSDTHGYHFKVGYTTNLEVPYLKPTIMALNSDESNLAMLLMDSDNLYHGTGNKVRIAVRKIRVSDG